MFRCCFSETEFLLWPWLVYSRLCNLGGHELTYLHVSASRVLCPSVLWITMMDKATLFLMIQTIILFSYKCSESRREIFWGLQINVLKVFPSRLIVSSHILPYSRAWWPGCAEPEATHESSAVTLRTWPDGCSTITIIGDAWWESKGSGDPGSELCALPLIRKQRENLRQYHGGRQAADGHS